MQHYLFRMKLTRFISQLLEEGRATVNGDLSPVEPNDWRAAKARLLEFYEEDLLEMPGNAPEFDAETALWAALYIYNALQLTILRDINTETVDQLLSPGPQATSADAVYSADLMLRYLPQLLGLAKGLSPQDIVVTKLKETAALWPFSSVGLETGPELPDVQLLLAHPSLRYAYADRIIARQDKSRAHQAGVSELVAEVLGSYGAAFWPEFNTLPQATPEYGSQKS
ncbi:MAG: hypothetical protein IT260_08850 [Saprospiraceae bacterium]|nr:hypothetical protein [Saprospiraceae bacterium]